jgi:uncharacterized membrane protein
MTSVATRVVFAPLSPAGVLPGTMLFAASLTPSLLPRSLVFQGVLSGLSFALGYAVGTGIAALWRYLGFGTGGDRLTRWLQRLMQVCIALGMIAAVACLSRATAWQNAVRALMGMELVDGVQPLRIALISVVVACVCLLLSRLLVRAFRTLSGRFRRVLPDRAGNLLGAIGVAIAVWMLSDGIIFKLGMRAADASFREVDALVPDDLTPPSDSVRSGGAGSFVEWRDLGRQGRLFVTSGPTAAEIEAFAGPSSMQPVRVYVGLNAAETPRARAQLALRELQRMGAFSRAVLIVATPTGTGWLDPGAMNTVEYLHRGNTAIVAAQYSYLPSPLALVTEGAYGAEIAEALFEVVYDYWTTLPVGARPRLYLFGLSLGALNAGRSFDLHDVLSDPFDGALWVGTPFRSAALQEIMATRHRDSPAWKPRFRNSTVVRFMNQDGGLREPRSRWAPLRIAYLLYASDPVTFFHVNTFYREPEWMRAPRGPDVVPIFRWYPLVTGLQLIADIAAGVGATPPGFGHNFAPAHYVEAWVALTEPAGWTEEALRCLAQASESPVAGTPPCGPHVVTGAAR